MEAAEDDEGAALAVPARELVRPLRERQVDGDPDDLRERLGGGGPWRRFSSQRRTSQPAGVAAAMLVSASDGVSTCLPKLACGSLG